MKSRSYYYKFNHRIIRVMACGTVLLSLCCFLFPISSIIFNPLRDCQAQSATLFQNSSNQLMQGEYSYDIIFQQGFEIVPRVGFGQRGYDCNDRTYSENFEMSIVQIRVTDFSINITVGVNTKITFIKVSYLAVDQDSGAFVIGQYYSDQLVNISATGSDERVEYIEVEDLSQMSMRSETAVFVNGIKVQSTNGFMIDADIEVQNSSTLLVTITVKLDMYVSMIQFCYLVVNPDGFDPQDMVHLQKFITNITSLVDSVQIPGSSTASFIIGLSSLYPNESQTLSFDIISTSDTLIFSNSDNSFSLTFTSILISQVDCEDKFWSLATEFCVTLCHETETSDPNTRICQPCHPNCLTCSKAPEYCTSCQEGLEIDQDRHTCEQPFDFRYLLFFIVIIPVILIIVIVCRKRLRRKRVKNKQFKEQPNISID